jgi:hypothetical protein
LGALLGDDVRAAAPDAAAPGIAPADGFRDPLAPKRPHFPGKAKRVVHIFMNGGMSHVDTFDPKPALDKWHGKAIPTKLPTERPTGAAFRSPFAFRRCGRSGLEISELFRCLGERADDLCVIRSMHADVPNHEPSLMLLNCGDARQARPSLGSWAVYGLGAETRNLPGFVVLIPGGFPIAESQNWQNAFLPGIYQGTRIDTSKDRVEDLVRNIRNAALDRAAQRRQLDFAQALNAAHAAARPDDAALEARIQSFELAFRMQTEAADAFDADREPAHVRTLYGPGRHARQMIVARRLLERGVRFIQIYHGDGQPWDHHDDLEVGHRRLARECDQPLAAFLFDLKQRGLLDDTLVMCTGEFGRTPTVEMPSAGNNQGKKNGRDHNHYGFSMWLAGGGVKGGHVHGATDDFGFKAVAQPVHVHDLHATVLHLLGFDHEKFTFRHAGRDYRLTDVHGRVVKEILA